MRNKLAPLLFDDHDKAAVQANESNCQGRRTLAGAERKALTMTASTSTRERGRSLAGSRATISRRNMLVRGTGQDFLLAQSAPADSVPVPK